MSAEVWLVVATVIMVGGIIVWFIGRSTSGAAKTQIQALEAEASHLKDENASLGKRLAVEEQKASAIPKLDAALAELGNQANAFRDGKAAAERDLAVAAEAVKAQTAINDELRGRLAAAEAQSQQIASELDAERQIASGLRTENATVRQALESERQQAEERVALLSDAQGRLTQQFKLLADEVLKRHGEEFSKQHKEQLSGILDPMRQKIVEFEQGLQKAQNESTKERATLQEQIRTLSEASARMTTETENLTRALKGKVQTQGAWGEMILSTILERSGLREGQEYLVQEHTTTDEGDRLRPDVVVNLPNDQRIVIDAKVSLTAFEQLASAEDVDARESAMTKHLASVRGHIKLLGSKEYHKVSGGELDYVIMFVPIEGALAVAVEADPGLTLMAADNNVAIATPTTLMIALRTVANIWHVERRNRNADEIAQRAGRLYDKFVGFIEDLRAVGSHLDNSRQSLDGAMSKLSTGQGNLLRQVELMKELGAKTQKSLPAELLDRSAVELLPALVVNGAAIEVVETANGLNASDRVDHTGEPA